MIGFRIDQAKRLFFDADRVINAERRAEKKWMSRFGAFVRQRAKTSIKRPGKKAKALLAEALRSGDEDRIREAFQGTTSQPDNPPLSHTDLLKRFIFFIYDPDLHSVLIGPARLSGKAGQAPEALEHGGPSEIASRRRGRQGRKIAVKPRPYMTPAFEAEKVGLPKLLADVITP